MRVALVYAEVYDIARFGEMRKEFPPFGVLYVAASLREGGHDPAIIAVDKTRGPLDLSMFDAVGFSLSSSATYGLLRKARHEALIRDDALIMVGGVHANFLPKESLIDFGADVLAVGESESTILDIMDAHDGRNFASVKGIWYRDDHGGAVRTPARRSHRDINTLPLPARDLLPVEDVVITDRLAGRNIRMAHVMFSRGCPFRCAFCAAGKTYIQYRSGESARAELRSLMDVYSIQGFAIVDDNFIVNRQKVLEIASSISDLGLKWSALSRVDTVDAGLLKKIGQAGCIEIKFGVESGSERLLRAMRKNTTQQQIRDAVTWARQAGIEAKAFIIHGYPGEDSSTTSETIRLLEEIGGDLARVSLFRFVPLPGSEVYGRGLNGGIRGTHHSVDWDGDWEKFHIHHNNRHWWGTGEDFAVVQREYNRLEAFIEARWGPQK